MKYSLTITLLFSVLISCSPKIDLNKERTSIDLTKDHEACAKYTKNMCMRPDIFSNNDRTCDKCSIRKHCSSHVKKFSKYYDEKSKK